MSVRGGASPEWGSIVTQSGDELRRVGDILPDAVGHDRTETRVMVAIFSGWEQVVGTKVAGHVQPLRLDGDALLVVTDHGAWATQIRAMSGVLVERLHKLSGGRVASLRVVSPGRSQGR